MNKKVFIYLFTIILIFFSSCRKDEVSMTVVNHTSILLSEDEPMTLEQIRVELIAQLSSGKEFKWEECSDYLLWSILMRTDNTMFVGYSSEAWSEQKSTELESEKKNVLDLINSSESSENNLKSGNDCLLHEDDFFTHILVKIENIETITQLRKNPNVRFFEPGTHPSLYDESALKSSGGCDAYREVTNSADYYTENYLNFGAIKMPWTYFANGINLAWTLSTGANISVGIIDTGTGEDANWIVSTNFKQTNSTRYLSKSSIRFGLEDFDQYDNCPHGSWMTSTIGAPRGVTDLMPGVAFDCNIIAYRVGDKPVILNEDHKTKVKEAFHRLADMNHIKIISISNGTIPISYIIKEGVDYAWAKGKLIVASGGTTLTNNEPAIHRNFAVYPASHENVLGVTGIKSNFTIASNAHYDNENIDFAVIMERSDDDYRRSPQAGYCYYNDYVGGSSVAAAMFSGIVALYWSKYPTLTRDAVITKLKMSAISNSNVKYGRINAFNLFPPPPPPPNILAVRLDGPKCLEIGKTGTWNIIILGGTYPITISKVEYTLNGTKFLTQSYSGNSFTRAMSTTGILQFRITLQDPSGTLVKTFPIMLGNNCEIEFDEM